MLELLQKHRSDLLTAIPDVMAYRSELHALNSWWRKITLAGKINSHNIANNIIHDMDTTQNKFNELQIKLIDNLLLEHLGKSVLENSSISQVAIDILIRNLFERTADVGFLATDHDIREFLQTQEKDELSINYIQGRLNEYVEKYSVYKEIVLLDPAGKVQAHLDQNNPISHSEDPLIQATLNSREEYVETFRHSDLQPLERHSLVYSCKITATTERGSPCIGILCLCFRFDNELRGIFAKLLIGNDTNTLLILDDSDRIIASSNEEVQPLEKNISTRANTAFWSDEDRQYLSIKTTTNGYEGFHGLGWSARVLAPLDKAFIGQGDEGPKTDISSSAIAKSNVFSRELRDIKVESVDVNADLSLLVLNGKITSARESATEFMPILQEIQRIGEKIADIFSSSVDTLQATVISSRLNDAKFRASLAVDIMDRNLYERANDCRWWALTSNFRSILGQDLISPQESKQLTAILASINDLYTVYTNLYLYDTAGIIIAISNPDEQDNIGSNVLDLTGAKEALLLKNSQKYSVSPFESSPLYGGRHTYIYNAAVTHVDNNRIVVGGIGIVFDSEPQFKAILKDSLPGNDKDEGGAGCFAVFTDREKKIISVANNECLQVGGILGVADDCFRIENGESSSKIITYEGVTYSLGYAMSSGYREYKTTGDYKNDILAFVLIPF